MFHLPAYLALTRWVSGRRVLVYDPSGPEGPRMLRDAGAALVLVVGDAVKSEPGIQARPRESDDIPLRARSVDAVLAIESFRELTSARRATLVREAARVIREDGLFAAWVPQPGTSLFGHAQGEHRVDFYALEESVSAAFPWVRMLAQMPWQGFSLAPLPEGDEPVEPAIRLREELLGPVVEASHYLALGTMQPPDPELIRACTMVPLPEGQVFTGALSEDVLDELEALREELSVRSARSVAAQNRTRELEEQLENLRSRLEDRATAANDELEAALDGTRSDLELATHRERELRAELETIRDERGRLVEELAGTREVESQLRAELARSEAALSERRAVDGHRGEADRNDLAILTRTVGEQEKALARVAEQLQSSREQLEAGVTREKELRAKLEALEGERGELQRQLDVRVAEGEGARKLAARVEAELEVLRTRHAEQGDRLAAKIEEASRLTGEVETLRSRLADQESSLQQTRSRAEALSASAAEGAEKGRMLAELAADRERLREELGQRARQVESLEEKMWEGREALQRERLENVRLGGEVERLRELLARGRDIEKQRGAEIERLGAELRSIELERVELKAMLRAREERLSQLLTEADQQVDRGQEMNTLIGEVEGQRGRLEALQAQFERAEHQYQRAKELAEERATELARLQEQLKILEKSAAERGDTAARLQTELDMRALEIEQLNAQLARAAEQSEQAQAERGELEARVEQREAELAKRDTELRGAKAREAELTRRVFDLEAVLDDVIENEQDSAPEAVLDLAKALDLGQGSGAEAPSGTQALRAELRRARAESEQLRAELAQLEQLGGASKSPEEREAALLRQLQRVKLENEIRASEQERMLLELDAAEQRIWEMTDASDRNAARFAASLAQLEKQKERVDQLLDELEVTRSLLAAEQARTLEQERLLASERAKLARAGLGSEGFPRSEDTGADEVFADLNPNPKLVQLGGPSVGASTRGGLELDADLERLVGGPVVQPPAPSRPPQVGTPTPIEDRGATSNHPIPSGSDPKRPRVVVEEVDEDEWEDP